MRLSLGDAPICSTTFCIQVSLGLQANLDGRKARIFCEVSPTRGSCQFLLSKLMNNLGIYTWKILPLSQPLQFSVYHHLNPKECQTHLPR